jgi:hypothetical protein
VVTAALTLLLLLSSIGCHDRAAARPITLVARGMTFVLEESPETPNPVISLRVHERVRLVLRNEAPGLLHDIEIAALNVRLDQIRAGENTSVTFTVPDIPGRHEYRCRPHAEMMRGIVDVTR